MAARTHSYTQAPAKGRSSSRATLALLLGILAMLAVPIAIEGTKKLSGLELLDAAWAIPVAAGAAIVSLLLARGPRKIKSSSRLLVAARVFAITGLCLALSSALAVGIYEFLLWKENH